MFRTSILLALALMACKTEPEIKPRPVLDPRASLARFADCAELRTYLVDAWTETLVESRYSYGRAVAEDDAEAGGDDGSDGGDGPSDYSETNVQEEGVDEPDIVKTDGEHIYVVQGDELSILKSWPAEETALLANLELEGWPVSMFLHGDRVLVFSYDWEDDGWGEDRYYSETTRLTVVNVSDRQSPEIEREIRYEGWLANARMVDGHVYAVLNTWTYMPDALWELAWDESLGLPQPDWNASEAEMEQMRFQARNILRPYVQEIVNGMSDEELLPLAQDGLSGEEPEASPVLACSDVYHPQVLADPNMMSVLHLDLSQESGPLAATGVMAGGWNIYASQDHLYIAQTSWDWWWGGPENEIETHIHKLAMENDGATYLGSGEVAGWLLNQFSMSEHDGYLRAATTDINWWGWDTGNATPANNVFVLEDTGGSLEVVGQVRGIAPNETIQSARFLGDKGFLVTYEQIDPLFTLDLSEPTSPRVVGELELPGFSTYLHPLGDDHLISVGFAGTMEGEITGMAVNIFDVSDFANPTLAHQLTYENDGWGWSEALYDHHAFTLHRGVLSMPLYLYDWDEDTGEDSFSGLVAISVDAEEGLDELGRVDHADMVRDSYCAWYEDEERPCEDSYWYASMRRSVVIEDNLFSISDYGVKVSELMSPEVEIARVLFNPIE